MGSRRGSRGHCVVIISLDSVPRLGGDLDDFFHLLEGESLSFFSLMIRSSKEGGHCVVHVEHSSLYRSVPSK